MGRKARLAAIGLVILCAGCAPQAVQVPVYSCPAPVIGDDPRLPVADLKEGDSIGQVLKAFSASLEACKGRVNELKLKLEAYRDTDHP